MTPGLRLLVDSSPRPRRLLGVIAWSIVESAPALVSGLAVSHAVDALGAHQPGPAAAWLAVLAAAAVTGALAARRLYAALSPIVEDLRDELMTATVQGTISRCATTGRPGASTVTQVVEQVDQVRNVVSAVLRSLRSTLAPLVAAGVGLALLDRRLALAALAPVTLALVVQAFLVPRTLARHRAAALAQERLGTDTSAVLGDLPGLRGIGAVPWARTRLMTGARDVVAADLGTTRVVALRQTLLALGAHAPLVTVLLASVPLVRRGEITAGTVLGTATYVLTALGPALTSLVSTAGSWLVELVVVLDRLALVAGHPKPPARAPQPAGATAGGHDIVLSGLGFAFRDGARPILADFDLAVTPGQHVAVVGASGTGKSTLARLIAGLEAATTGSVSLARPVCFVPQETYVFSGTLRENLVHLAAEPIETVDLISVAAAHGLGPLVERIGLDAEIRSRDEALTAGDRQRIILARAWLSGAPVVVLDEATSLLDPDEERALEQRHRAAGRTLVTIAHHLDVALRADRVVYFDGATTHVGRHDELLASCAPYGWLHSYATRGGSATR